MKETITVVEAQSARDALWSPSAGPALKRFLDSTDLDPAAAGAIRERAASILGACLPPSQVGAGTRTGLVVGYVQSGKTQSFTAVTALARDNGYPLVILLAGTKKNLHAQTSDRLRRDLSANDGASSWVLVDNLGPSNAKLDRVRKVLTASTSDDSSPRTARTVVVTAMKNPARLKALTKVLRSFEADGALELGVPILIIDDEADQAGLNASEAPDATATYAAILALREAAGSHSYLMYTATPQAPLLLELSDRLSPDFVRVLTPGEAYTGGAHFFGDARKSFVREIAAEEVAAIKEGGLKSPPASLERALAVFLLGTLAEDSSAPRSMLVHPSHDKESHETFRRWVQGRVDGFERLLRAGGRDLEELRKEVLDEAWRDLASTVEGLPALETLLPKLASFIANEVAVRVVNSETSAEGEIEWSEARAWILVGGYKLDRGFTIEGLTVTYMPRSVGGGNADSIQQRARFFGYKSTYADYCRAWLDAALVRAYVAYVEHERHLLNELRQVEDAAQGLNHWKRRMLLDPALKPCRQSVVTLPHVRTAIHGSGWIQLGAVRSPIMEQNLRLFETVNWQIDSVRHNADTRPGVADGDAHRRVVVEAKAVVEQVLGEWIAIGIDAARLYQVAIVLAGKLDDAGETLVELVLMDSGRPRSRKFTTPADRIENLHVGRSAGYAGDKEVHDPSLLTIQFHRVIDSADSVPSARVMPALAIWLPKHFESGVIYEVDW